MNNNNVGSVPSGSTSWNRSTEKAAGFGLSRTAEWLSPASRASAAVLSTDFAPLLAEAKRASMTNIPPMPNSLCMLHDYQPNGFFDEMSAPPRDVRKHYRKFLDRFVGFTPDDFELKRRAVDLAFLRQGITFNVYGDSQ